MKTVSLSGSLRENVGKKDAKAQRAAGKVPCVIYGGKQQVHFSTDEVNFKPILYSPSSFLINVNIDNTERLCILQDVQSHPVTDKILHVDFLEIDQNKPVTIHVPIRIAGTSPGVLRGGKLVKKFRKLKIKALAQHLPDEVEISISDLDLGQTIKVGDLKMDNVDFLDLKSGVIVTVQTTRNVEAATPGK